jgi:hypothetical protein
VPKLVYFIASTIDRFIADPSGADPSGPDGFFVTGQDYIDHLVQEYPETIPGPFHQALGIQPGNRHFDAVVMGRNTYELVVKLNPVAVGSGIPLFDGEFRPVPYRLADTHPLPSGVLFLTYVKG